VKARRPKSFNQSGKIRAVVQQWLGSAAPCLGYWSFYPLEDVQRPIHIPGLELDTKMGVGAEVEIEYTFRVVKRGKVPRKKCMNPWPAHRCPKPAKKRGAK
jgi:hypothetical protein